MPQPRTHLKASVRPGPRPTPQTLLLGLQCTAASNASSAALRAAAAATGTSSASLELPMSVQPCTLPAALVITYNGTVCFARHVRGPAAVWVDVPPCNVTCFHKARPLLQVPFSPLGQPHMHAPAAPEVPRLSGCPRTHVPAR